MSVQELQKQVRDLAQNDLRQFANWWRSEGEMLLDPVAGEGESDSVKTELLRRQQDYREHPERFQEADEAALQAMFDRLADARARLTSAR